jgi:hypothetical protein
MIDLASRLPETACRCRACQACQSDLKIGTIPVIVHVLGTTTREHRAITHITRGELPWEIAAEKQDKIIVGGARITLREANQNMRNSQSSWQTTICDTTGNNLRNMI